MRNASYNTERLRYWLFADRIPLTKLLIVINVLTFFLVRLFSVRALLGLAFDTSSLLLAPWSVVTYPLIGLMDPIGLLFSGYWLWIAGGSLERAWGTRTFGLFLFGTSAATAIMMFAGALTFNVSVMLAGLWLPLSAVTIAFCMLNPEQQILFFFLIPLKLKYLALIDVALVLVGFGLPMGIFALTGCALAYWYVTRGRSYGYGSRRHGRAPEKDVRVYPRRGGLRKLNPFAWYKDYREQKKLRDFLDRSGFDDR